MICNLIQYCPGDQIQNTMNRGTWNTYGERRDLYKILVRKRDGKSPLGRHRRRWDGNIKLDLQEFGCGGRHWIVLEITCVSGD